VSAITAEVNRPRSYSPALGDVIEQIADQTGDGSAAAGRFRPQSGKNLAFNFYRQHVRSDGLAHGGKNPCQRSHHVKPGSGQGGARR
jgi:hypothetical protein